MNKPRPLTKCRRCKQPYAEHTYCNECGDDGQPLCADGQAFLRYAYKAKQAAHSFSKAEVDWLDAAMKKLLAHGDCTQLARTPQLGSVRRKVTVMKAAVERIKSS